MSSPPDDYDVGYKRPPKHTRWKKGQSGNPRRQYPARSTNTLEMIDRLLLSLVDIVESGTVRKVTALEAILLQLWQKDFSGDRRALSVHMKYEELARENARRGVEIELVDSDYTRALAERESTEGTGHE